MSRLYIEDRLVSLYIIKTDMRTGITYVEFPSVHDNDYQKKRFYSDERPLTLEEFNKMRHL